MVFNRKPGCLIQLILEGRLIGLHESRGSPQRQSAWTADVVLMGAAGKLACQARSSGIFVGSDIEGGFCSIPVQFETFRFIRLNRELTQISSDQVSSDF